MLQDSPICPHAHRTESHIKIAKADPEQTQPRPEHVPAIQTTHAGVGAITGLGFCKLIAKSSDQMSEGVAAECVAAQQINIDRQHDRADANAERIYSRR